MVQSTPDVVIEEASTSSQASSLISKARFDEIQFLDYLSTDFLYLRRFVLASDQMVRLLQTEAARNNETVQEKLVDTIEIAKETLAEAGASARPFIPCPTHLVRYRDAYLNMLSAARSLVPYMKDPDTKLRLRRLLLPLTSTSRFRVMLPSGFGTPKAEHSPSVPTWREKYSNGMQRPNSGAPVPGNSCMPRWRMKHGALGSAVIKFAQSSLSYSSYSSDSASRPFTSESVSSARRDRVSPYPNRTLRENKGSDAPPNDHGNTGNAGLKRSQCDPSTNSPSPQDTQPQPEPEQKSSDPPLIHYVSPLSPRPVVPPIANAVCPNPEPFGLLQQQQNDFAAVYSAYRTDARDTCNTPGSTTWEWSSQTRISLSGIDCNLPKVVTAAPLNVLKKFSEEEYDEADENFRNGYGWRPTRWRPRTESEADISSPALSMKWCKRWDDDENPVPTSELVTTMLATLPGESIQPVEPTPLSDSVCISERMLPPLRRDAYRRAALVM